MNKDIIKHIPFLYAISLYLWHKWKNGDKVKFWLSTRISSKCRFEGMNMVGKRTLFHGCLGYGSYIGNDSLVNAEIGRFTSIGSGFTYINGTHAYKSPFVSTSPLFFSLGKERFFSGKSFAKRQMFNEFRYFDKDRGIVNKIGSDCWIGSNVTIIGGVEIKDGAVVLAHAVVTKDVPPYAIVGGMPARVIGYRYDDETISFLLKTKWWNNTIKWLKEHWMLFCDISAFRNYFSDMFDSNMNLIKR